MTRIRLRAALVGFLLTALAGCEESLGLTSDENVADAEARVGMNFVAASNLLATAAPADGEWLSLSGSRTNATADPVNF